VAFGLGQLVDGVETHAPTEAILAALKYSMERITELMSVLEETVASPSALECPPPKDGETWPSWGWLRDTR
jgi:hypothetical protein